MLNQVSIQAFFILWISTYFILERKVGSPEAGLSERDRECENAEVG